MSIFLSTWGVSLLNFMEFLLTHFCIPLRSLYEVHKSSSDPLVGLLGKTRLVAAELGRLHLVLFCPVLRLGCMHQTALRRRNPLEALRYKYKMFNSSVIEQETFDEIAH